MREKKNFKLFISILFLFAGITYSLAEEVDISRLMPLGDSITYDNRISDLDDPRPISTRTGYRSHLWYLLEGTGKAIDFVGSRVAGQAITPAFDPDNEGHPGWTSGDIAEKVYSYMLNSQPTSVLLHIGTNDHGTYAGGIDTILNEINLYEQSSGQSVHVYVALIINRKDDDRIIRLFNDNVKQVVATHITNGDNITLVDMFNNVGLVSSDYADETHPNDNGYRKMANVWFTELLKPYNQSLSAFPYTIVESKYIQSININATATSVDFIVTVPDTGITF
jgi:hypothetical protein